jgi:hypothetical protein
MGLRDLVKRLKTPVEEIDAGRLRDRFAALGLVDIAQVPMRTPTRFGGQVKRLRIVPRSGMPSLEAVVSDGSGDAVLVFSGRREVAGLELGRHVTVEGVAHLERGHKVVLNPAYTLL